MIFVIIGCLLVATMYSSSTLFVFAEFLTSCTNLNETKAHCTVIHAESYPLGSDCTKNPDGTYSCTPDKDQDHKTNLKVTDEDAIQLGSDWNEKSGWHLFLHPGQGPGPQNQSQGYR